MYLPSLKATWAILVSSGKKFWYDTSLGRYSWSLTNLSWILMNFVLQQTGLKKVFRENCKFHFSSLKRSFEVIPLETQYDQTYWDQDQSHNETQSLKRDCQFEILRKAIYTFLCFSLLEIMNIDIALNLPGYP